MLHRVIVFGSISGKILCCLAISVMVLLLAGCDNARFTGFNYDAQQLAKSVVITGNITSVFTGESVDGATVAFDGQETVTDVYGDYAARYFLSVDDDANRPVPVTISAVKYFTFDTTLVVFPVDNRLNARLTYGAPIVQSAILDVENAIATTVIFDYQGADNIDQVFAFGLYAPTDGSRINFYHQELMQEVRQINANTAEYQVQLPEVLSNGVLMYSRLRIYATDKDDFDEDRLFIF